MQASKGHEEGQVGQASPNGMKQRDLSIPD